MIRDMMLQLTTYPARTPDDAFAALVPLAERFDARVSAALCHVHIPRVSNFLADKLVGANQAIARENALSREHARQLAEAFAARLPEANRGEQLLIEATTSWAYVGAGLRIQLELLGPEYSMEFSSLSAGLKIFLSRQVAGSEGEDLVEKQNAEQGLMPVVEDEAGIYGYTDENRHTVEAFRTGRMPAETFADGVGVMEMLMGLYRSAEL
ncbi:MAG: hypothetical protein ACK40O_12220, partial [Allosphingosinicella sp.]